MDLRVVNKLKKEKEMVNKINTNIPAYTLISYKRDKKRNPVGVVVATKNPATGDIHYGHALCRKGDRFTKARALAIALGRTDFNTYDTICKIPSLQNTLNRVKERAKKYFKNDFCHA
jgi:hypothetical protein